VFFQNPTNGSPAQLAATELSSMELIVSKRRRYRQTGDDSDRHCDADAVQTQSHGSLPAGGYVRIPDQDDRGFRSNVTDDSDRT
jgi:hypothetical protein